MTVERYMQEKNSYVMLNGRRLLTVSKFHKCLYITSMTLMTSICRQLIPVGCYIYTCLSFIGCNNEYKNKI